MKSTMALYATYGAHRKFHRVVLYFNHETDWTRKQRASHGNTGKALCGHPMTIQANMICCLKPYYACSFRYAAGQSEVDRFKSDLKALHIPENCMNIFLEKALPFLIAE